MKILGIETSCDDTAVALVEARGGIRNPSFSIIESLVSSQIDVHKEFGGVVPNLAKREHIRALPLLVKKIAERERARIMNNELGIMKEERIKNKRRKTIIHNSSFFIPDLDLIAVTSGPGLEPALWAGITFAEDLGKKLGVPVVGAHHLEGHLYTFLLESFGSAQDKQKSKLVYQGVFPAIGLLISGGHTILVLMESFTKFIKLGETRDDAVGEAFDKVARLLSLPFPGGPHIERIAKEGDSSAIAFPRPMIHEKNYDFSFSGLKTAVLYYLRDHALGEKGSALPADVAASFQAAAFDVLITKSLRAAREFGAHSILVAGGVAANRTLKNIFSERIRKESPSLHLVVPRARLCTDNGVMMAVAGYMNYLHKKKWKLVAEGSRSL